jgi:hypothetical protein
MEVTMDNQPKRVRLGTKSCTECRRRKVKCVFDDDQAECQQCNRHSLTCQPQNAESFPEDKDEIIQEVSQFAGQVEARMIRMQAAIDTLASKLDSQTNPKANHRSNAGSGAECSQIYSQQFEVGVWKL